MTEGEEGEEQPTYVISVNYSNDSERDSDTIVQLSKNVAKTAVKILKEQIEAKKEFATVEIDEEGFYMFRLFNIKNVSSIDVDEE